jgi:hypothetical protein
VAIVDGSYLLEADQGTWERFEEKYAQLRAHDGEIDFITINEYSTPFKDKFSTIKALPKQPWRRDNDGV